MEVRNKKAIVTGGAGVIGRELINILLKRGVHIRCFDIVKKPSWMPEQVDYFECDLSLLDPRDFTDFTPDIIFHLAAVFERTDEPITFWSRNFSSNVIATHKVIDAATRCKSLLKFVFASSYLVYSTSLYLYKKPQAKPRVLREGDLINPRNICGAAKYYSEKELDFLDSFKKYNFTMISARIYRVYGLGSRDIVSRWARAALAGKEMELYGEKNSYDYIFAGDVALGLLKLAESDTAKGPVNLTFGKSIKVSRVIAAFKKYIPDLKIKKIPAKHLYEASCADASLLKKFTGWTPQVDIEEGVGRVIEFEKGLLNR